MQMEGEPVLRWHPWAPLASAAIFVGAVFVAGVSAGAMWQERAAAERDLGHSLMQMMIFKEEPVRPGIAVNRRADLIDQAVVRWASFERVDGFAPRALNALDGLLNGAERSRQLHDAVQRLAQFRLAELAGSAPRWEKTSRICAETDGRLWGAERYQRAAQAYSYLLQRPIAPEAFMPAARDCKENRS